MPALPVVWTDPLDVDARLSRLALDPEPLRDALLAGYMAKLATTSNDPPSYPGFTFWARTTRALREQFIPLGWMKSDAGNFSTVVAPTGRVALVVATGDQDTGISTARPKTKFPKGPATAAAVALNQFDLFGPPAASGAQGQQLWVLLISVQPTLTGRVVRAEVSLPVNIGDDGRVEEWQERIILPPIEDNDDGGRRVPEPGPEFDITVVRRTG